ncbi:MAG: hypothetical protein ACTS8P_00865 [Arsenophonus sp. NC-XBC3-MAG3]
MSRGELLRVAELTVIEISDYTEQAEMMMANKCKILYQKVHSGILA